jgi:hypothetical protein
MNFNLFLYACIALVRIRGAEGSVGVSSGTEPCPDLHAQ